MDNRRTERRRKLTAFTPVRDGERGGLLGFLVNLTLQGALIRGQKPLERDARVLLNIEFPDILPGLSTRQMTIPARVARCGKDKEGAQDYNIGFEFEGVEPEQTMLLQALMDRYHY